MELTFQKSTIFESVNSIKNQVYFHFTLYLNLYYLEYIIIILFVYHNFIKFIVYRGISVNSNLLLDLLNILIELGKEYLYNL